MSTTTKKKTMLNTKDITAGSGRIKPVIDPGNHTIKINKITLDPTPYDSDAWNLLLHVETEPVTGEFEGFLTDINNPSSPRHEGQVGRVRYSPWPFKDAKLPSGREIERDREVLKALVHLAETLDVREQLDMIDVEEWSDYIEQCNKLFSNTPYFKACIGGREWENKEGYINNDLFLPRSNKTGVCIEKVDVENSRLMAFNRTEHVKGIKKKDEVTSFEPNVNGTNDFEL